MNNKVKYSLVLVLPLLCMSQIAVASCEDAEAEGVECVVVTGDENDNVDQSSGGGGFVYTDGGSQESDSANNSSGNGGGSSSDSDSEEEPKDLKEQCKLMIQADYTRCNRLASEKYETNLKQNCGDKKSTTIGITTPIFSFTLTDEAYEKCEKEVLSTRTKDYKVCEEGKSDGDLQCFLMQP